MRRGAHATLKKKKQLYRNIRNVDMETILIYKYALNSVAVREALTLYATPT